MRVVHVGIADIVRRMIVPFRGGVADVNLTARHPLVMARSASHHGSRRHSLKREGDEEQPQQGYFERSTHAITDSQRQNRFTSMHALWKNFMHLASPPTAQRRGM